MRQMSRFAVIVALTSGVFMSQGWLLAQASRTAEAQFKAAQNTEEVKGDLKGAIEQYKKLAQGSDRAIAAKALVRMAECYEKLGQSDARKTYELVVRDFKDQPESAATAGTRLAAMQSPAGPRPAAPARGDGHVQLAWFDRTGEQIATIGEPGGYRGPELSPDGKRLAIRDQDLISGDIWILDAGRGARSRFTFETDGSRRNSMPIWSPDGNQIVFGSFRNGKFGLYVKRTDGAGVNEQLVVESDYPTTPMSWSPDGRFIVYTVRDPKQPNLWTLPLTGDRTPYRTIAGSFGDSHGQISPDGKWIAYGSTDAGTRMQIHVRAFPDGREKWQVSTDSGNFPRWRGDGKELYFLSRGKMMATEIRVDGSSIQPGTPRALFDSGYDNSAGGRSSIGHWHTYAVSADGQRFLIPRPAGTPASSSVGVLENSTLNGGLGFTGSWFAPGAGTRIHDNYRLAGDSLSFPNLAVTSNRIETAFTFGPAGIGRELAKPITAGDTSTVYFSMLLRPEGVLGVGGNGNGYFGAYLDGTGTDLFVGKPGRGAIGEYVLENRTGPAQVRSGVSAVVGQTVLLVLQADLRPGLDGFTLYLNPDPCKPKPAPGVVKDDIDIGDTNAVVIISAGAFSVDELRLGPRFEDAVPCARSRR